MQHQHKTDAAHGVTGSATELGTGPGKRSLTEMLSAPAGKHRADEEEASSPAPVKLVAGRPPKAKSEGAAGHDEEAPMAAAARALAIGEACQRYAPLVYLAKDESYGPASARKFIQNSELKWSHDEGGKDHTHARRGQVDETKLGRGGYSDRVTRIGGIDPHGRQIHSNEDVRPNDGHGDGGNEGFFLDLDNSKRKTLSEGTNAPVYFEAKPYQQITYWFFYAYNDGPFKGIAGVGGDVDNHEGDWERIVVHLDRANRATKVVYYQHESNTELAWDKAPKQGTHPIVYSARGSHASYAKPGKTELHTKVKGHDLHTADDHASKGAAWQTWNHLTDVKKQQWYGYGGAWGEVGNPVIDKVVHADTTGPQGPSHK